MNIQLLLQFSREWKNILHPGWGPKGDVVSARIVAFIIDSIVSSIVASIIIIPGLITGSDIILSLLGLIGAAVYMGYWLLLEGIYGYKPGKYMMGLVVVKSDGSDCTGGQGDCPGVKPRG